MWLLGVMVGDRHNSAHHNMSTKKKFPPYGMELSCDEYFFIFNLKLYLSCLFKILNK